MADEKSPHPPSLAEAQVAKGIHRQPAPPAAQPAPERERAVYILGPERLKWAEYERNIHVANPGEGVTLDDLLKPECWASVTKVLQPWAHIEVRAEDGSYYAELLVTGVDRSWAQVAVLNYVALTTKDVSLTQATESKFEIRHTPGLRWHIIRKSDRHIIKDNMQLRIQAEDALREHLKTVPA